MSDLVGEYGEELEVMWDADSPLLFVGHEGQAGDEGGDDGVEVHVLVQIRTGVQVHLQSGQMELIREYLVTQYISKLMSRVATKVI